MILHKYLHPRFLSATHKFFPVLKTYIKSRLARRLIKTPMWGNDRKNVSSAFVNQKHEAEDKLPLGRCQYCWAQKKIFLGLSSSTEFLVPPALHYYWAEQRQNCPSRSSLKPEPQERAPIRPKKAEKAQKYKFPPEGFSVHK